MTRDEYQKHIEQLIIKNTPYREQYGLEMIMPGVYQAGPRVVSPQLLRYAYEHPDELVSFIKHMDDLSRQKSAVQEKDLRFEAAFALRLITIPQNAQGYLHRWIQDEPEEHIQRELMCLLAEQELSGFEHEIITILSRANSYQLVFACIYALSRTAHEQESGGTALMALWWLQALYTELPQKCVKFNSNRINRQILEHTARVEVKVRSHSGIEKQQVEQLSHHFHYLWRRHRLTQIADDEESWHHLLYYLQKRGKIDVL